MHSSPLFKTQAQMLLGEEIENDFHRDERAGKKERKQNG